MDHSTAGEPESDTVAPADPAATAAARRRLREALDGILPDVTGDELMPSGESHRSRTDEDYLRDRPPHHG
jgi:hypothetical protein